MDINKKSDPVSVITEHRLETGHNFNWQNIKILDIENRYGKRLISKCIHIKRQKNSLNRKTDTELFPDIPSYFTNSPLKLVNFPSFLPTLSYHPLPVLLILRIFIFLHLNFRSGTSNIYTTHSYNYIIERNKINKTK